MTLPLISFGDLPPEGRTYTAEIRTDVFGLGGEYDPIFIPPFQYEVNVRLDDGDVIVEGTAEATFSLQCSRCAARLPWKVSLDPYFSCEEKEGDTLDLTAQLREDILLTLPGYPRCGESNVDPKPCQTDAGFAPESEFLPLAGDEPTDTPGRNVWEALDRLPPSDSPDASNPNP